MKRTFKALLLKDEAPGAAKDSLAIANKELIFQNEEKEKRAAELAIANKELIFQNEEKEKCAAELRLKNIILKTLQETSLDAILVVDDNEHIISYNQQFIDLWQLPPQLLSAGQDPPVLKSGAELLKNPEEFLAKVGYLVAHKTEKSRDELQLKDGRIIDRYSAPVTGTDGQYYGRVWYFRDITERKLAESQLKESEAKFRLLFERSMDGILILNDNHFIECNPATLTMMGYNSLEQLGNTPPWMISPPVQPDGHSSEEKALEMIGIAKTQGSHRFEWVHRRMNGEDFPVEVTLIPLKFAGSDVIYVTWRDITERKQDEAEIHNLAFYDPLTGLPNRRLLHDRLQHAFAVSARHRIHIALLCIDLDNFKTLNDTRGHNIGDLLLIEVAKRLQDSVREEDTAARLGGDEFVMLLEDLGEEETQAAAQAEAVGERILAAISQPYALYEQEYNCTASIGVSLFCRNDDTSMDEVLKHADAAMYQAKNAGRNTLRFFDPAMQEILEARAALESDLRRALVENQFRLYYQMQVDHSGHILGAEVLVRWQHPQRGLVSPLEFIPLAEETGLILPIGQWVLETACTQLKVWETDPLTRDLQLAVNVSARQLRQPDFVKQVRQAIRSHAFNPNRLKLEITESLVLDNIDDTIVKMQALRKVGVRFSMDDFGTGYSSLAYLTKLPLDQLKIDQSFVRNIGVKHNDAVIVQTIIGMAGNLGMEVIAEGVETEDQRAFLEQHGCTLCQGYLFGMPVPVEEFEARLKSS